MQKRIRKGKLRGDFINKYIINCLQVRNNWLKYIHSLLSVPKYALMALRILSIRNVQVLF